ncbi:MAG: hypothetical protein H3C62_04600, partial [Gemmatimonadaceae bacterium]|nr:hypothetical protein [Gemmatimonadaceae bacterium]
MYRLSTHAPLDPAFAPWRGHTVQGDAPLLAGYDPARSLAWLGAMPDPTQLGLFDAPVASEDAAADRAFHKAGFSVRALAGKGSRRRIAAFTRAHHYLRGAGMAGGIAFGLFAPNGAMVGVAVFARPTHPKTAAGMFPRPLDVATLGALSHHADVAESEVLDF